MISCAATSAANFASPMARKAVANPTPEVLFVRPDIVALVLGETVQEHGAGTCAIRHQIPEATPPPLPWPCDPLLDEAAAEIGIDQATFGAFGRLSRPKNRPPPG
jgi:hypothetical protein